MTFSVYKDLNIAPVPNEDYSKYTLSIISGAKSRLWASMFIVNPVVHQDPGEVVRGFLQSLSYAAWRGVDVRLLIGNSISKDIYVANATTMNYCRHLSVPIRYFKGNQRRSLHSKYVVADDDAVLLGSHNWTNSASTANTEDSVFVESNEIAKLLATEHETLWHQSREEAENDEG